VLRGNREFQLLKKEMSKRNFQKEFNCETEMSLLSDLVKRMTNTATVKGFLRGLRRKFLKKYRSEMPIRRCVQNEGSTTRQYYRSSD
jgi:hypothetical protein